MVVKVQVMTPEEVERNNKIREEQDRVCKKIMLFCGWSIVLLLFVYFIVLLIIISFG